MHAGSPFTTTHKRTEDPFSATRMLGWILLALIVVASARSYAHPRGLLCRNAVTYSVAGWGCDPLWSFER